MRWERTATAVFTAEFTTVGGADVALLAPPAVKIVNPSIVTVATGSGTLIGGSTYQFSWLVPTDAPLGMWKIEWLGETLDSGLDMPGEEWFEVVALGVVYPSAFILQLRNLVDRRLPGMVDADLFFTDNELHSLYLNNGSDLWMAAFEAWLIKAGVFSDLIDITESGASRKLSQRYKNAISMAEFFRKRIDTDAAASIAASSRVVGKVLSLRNDPTDIFGIYTLSGISVQNRNWSVTTYALTMGSGTLEEMGQRALTPAWYPG